MTAICDLKCEACRAGAPALSDDEILKLSEEVPDWEVQSVSEIKRIARTFKFSDFRSALQFTDRVGEAAEENGHHPAILTEWGRVTVTYWTHKIKGLHKSDFIMAAKTDKLYGGES